jgi:hypothetical protein
MGSSALFAAVTSPSGAAGELIRLTADTEIQLKLGQVIILNHSKAKMAA